MLKKYRIGQSTLLGLFVLSLAACVSPANINNIQPEFSPTYRPVEASSNLHGSIYQAGNERSLFEDMKARRVGDILTIILVEQTSGQKSSDNTANQSTDMNITAPVIGGVSKTDLGISLNSNGSFSGDSGSSQSNSLNGNVAVTVTEVLLNGNLVVKGEKWIQINQGNEYIRLQGVIRPKDINTNNTLYSTQVADARISYGGTGTNARSNNPGWATKILFSSLWPF